MEEIAEHEGVSAGDTVVFDTGFVLLATNKPLLSIAHVGGVLRDPDVPETVMLEI